MLRVYHFLSEYCVTENKTSFDGVEIISLSIANYINFFTMLLQLQVIICTGAHDN